MLCCFLTLNKLNKSFYKMFKKMFHLKLLYNFVSCKTNEAFYVHLELLKRFTRSENTNFSRKLSLPSSLSTLSVKCTFKTYPSEQSS